MTTPNNPPNPAAQPRFDPNAAHHQRPKLRPVRGFPVQAQGPNGQAIPMVGLADARQISEKVVFTVPAAQAILPLLDGSRSLDDIVAQVGRGLTREILEQLVAQLDDACLLEGPSFERLLAKVRKEFDESTTLPPASTVAFAEALATQAAGKEATEEQKAELGPRKMREAFDLWMKQALEKADKPSFDELPKAIVAPHLDYQRGWLNYAATYGRLRVCDRPDRVIILGTNHFGSATGVAGCNKGFESPLGTCAVASDVVAQLESVIGPRLFEHRFDHEREHSIELHIPWIQHVFSDAQTGQAPTVFGALIHDPTVANGESYDGKGVSLDSFVGALKQVLPNLPGRTLIVSSADLSHAGPAFGDPKPLAGEDPEAVRARNNVVQHDLQMLDLISKNQPQDLLASMAWQQNPTRWCSIGNLVATMLITEPTSIQLLNYAAAMDPKGAAMVSSASMAMF